MCTFLFQPARRGVRSQRCLGLSTANLVVDHLLCPILLREERHELDDVGVVRVELIPRPVKAHDERSVIMLGGDNGWRSKWVWLLLPDSVSFRLSWNAAGVGVRMGCYYRR